MVTGGPAFLIASSRSKVSALDWSRSAKRSAISESDSLVSKPFEAPKSDVKVRHARELFEQFGQLPLVLVARDLVEGDVERLLALNGQVDHADVRVRGAMSNEHFEALVAADQLADPHVQRLSGPPVTAWVVGAGLRTRLGRCLRTIAHSLLRRWLMAPEG